LAKRTEIHASSPEERAELLEHTSNIVSAYLNKNETPLRQLPEVLRTVYSILSNLGDTGGAGTTTAHENWPLGSNSGPAEKSITPDYLICLEDGAKLRTLKRYLFRKYQLTPEQYRQKWNLPPDYPMVAPNYASKRSDLAKKMGLGHKTSQKRKGKKSGVRSGAHP